MSISPIVNPVSGKVVYRIRVYAGMVDGKPKAICRTCGTYREAQIMEQQMLNVQRKAKMTDTLADLYKLERMTRSGNTEVRLDAAFDLAQTKPHGRDPGAERLGSKRGQWNDFLHWMRHVNPLYNTMNAVTPKMAENYIGFLRKNGPSGKYFPGKEKHLISQDTVNEYHRTLMQVFDDLKLDTGLPENPFAHIRKQKPRRTERNAYTVEQLNTIFAKADDYVRPLFFIGLFTGLAEGDVCTLKKSEILFDRHYIYRYRRKTSKISRKVSAIPMMKILEDYLRTLCNTPDASEYVLPEQAADYLRDRSRVSKRVKKFLEIDCDFTTCDSSADRAKHQSVLDFHSLRHTFCSIAGAVGIPQNVVQNIVGHMDSRMTELYSRHVSEQDGLRGIHLLENRAAELDFAGKIPVNNGFPEVREPEPEREKLLDMVKNMDAGQVKKLLASMA